MVKLDTLPDFVGGNISLRRESMSFGQAAGMVTTGGLATVGRSMSIAVETQNHTVTSMIVFLHRKLYVTRSVNTRAENWIGRIINKFTGENPYYVLLSGHHLIQCLNMTKDDRMTMSIQSNIKYGIRLDIAENILNNLKSLKS